jgi:hypothetical protein
VVVSAQRKEDKGEVLDDYFVFFFFLLDIVMVIQQKLDY